MDTAQFFDIQALTFDPKLQVRVRINDEQVAQYAECMATEEDMKKFPPVEIFYDGVKYWLADGHHRRAAAEKAGHSKIWASVKSGTHDDALWAAISGNGKQGFGLTKADRQRAIILALKCFPNKSNRAIADAVGCNEKTIRNYRDSTADNSAVENERRVGKDGKSRPAKQKTKKQASTKKALEPEETPVASTADETCEPAEQPSEQTPQFRPGSLPTKKYVGETQLKPIPRDRPEVLVANLIAFFPQEFVPNTAREIFKMLHNRYGKEVTKPLALEFYQEYGRRK